VAAMKILVLLLSAALPLSAELTFDAEVKDLNVGADQEEAICDFEFSNDGDAPVEIVRYHASCSCTGVKIKDAKLRYEPGEKGLIRAVFDLKNLAGDVPKSIQVWLKDDPANQPSITLSTRIHIPVLVEIQPPTLKWDVSDAAAPEERVISIQMNGDKPIHITSVESGNQNFQAELKTLEEGRKYELRVKPSSVATPMLGVILMRTDSASPRYAVQRAFAVVRQPVAKAAP
jgi:hypothetical protein